jgi:hypothetical protein
VGVGVEVAIGVGVGVSVGVDVDVGVDVGVAVGVGAPHATNKSTADVKPATIVNNLLWFIIFFLLIAKIENIKIGIHFTKQCPTSFFRHRCCRKKSWGIIKR